jgi:hypothetical protein
LGALSGDHRFIDDVGDFATVIARLVSRQIDPGEGHEWLPFVTTFRLRRGCERGLGATPGLERRLASGQTKVGQVDPNICPSAVGTTTGAPWVGTPLCAKTNAVELCGVIDLLGRRKASCNIYLVVMATPQEVWTEIEILLWAVAGDRSGESYPQHPPGENLSLRDWRSDKQRLLRFELNSLIADRPARFVHR